MPTVEFMGSKFITGKSQKFDNDLRKVMDIMSKGKRRLTIKDRADLLAIYNVAYHEGGKIEGISSCDSSCANCSFCQKMIAIAEGDPTIICGHCYDLKQEQYKINALNRHSLNAIIMSVIEYDKEELCAIPLTAITRINSSGDTPNETYARNMLNLGWVNIKKANIGYWAKNIPPIVVACDAVGKPSNVVLIQSSVKIGRPAKLAPYFDYTFTVYPDKESTIAAIQRGSSPCNGMKCRVCNYKCYFKKHKGTDIAEVARIPKAEAKKINNLIK